MLAWVLVLCRDGSLHALAQMVTVTGHDCADGFRHEVHPACIQLILILGVFDSVPSFANDRLQLWPRAQIFAQAINDEAESGLAREDSGDSALGDAGVVS